MQETFLKKYGFLFTSAFLFLIILAIVFRSFIFNPDLLMLNSDQLNGIGSKLLRAQDFVLTEWDDSRLGGVPTIDALFGDAYHPLVLVQFLTDPARAIGFKFILTIFIAFCSAMLLAYSFTKDKYASPLLGFLYALSPQYFTYIYGGHDGKMLVFAIAPLAILAIRKIIHDAKYAYAFVFVFCLVWMILGSHLQLTYLFLWGVGFYALYEAFSLKVPLKIKTFRLSISLVALVFGLLISLFQLLPPYLYTTKDSVRGTGDKTNYGHAVSWSLHQEELGDLIIPGFLGVDVYEQDQKTGNLKSSSLISYSAEELRGFTSSPFYYGHNPFKLNHDSAGIVLTFLAFLCFFIRGKTKYSAFWFLGSALILSYGMGAHSPLFKIWYEFLPGVKNFRAPSMALFWLPLIFVMLAIPVLKDKLENKQELHLEKGCFLFAVLLLLVFIARFHWSVFLGTFGFIIALLYGLLFIGVVYLVDTNQKLTLNNFWNGFKTGFKESSRIKKIVLLCPFVLVGFFMLSGEKILNNPLTAPYFKALNYSAMEASATKMIPSFLLVLVISCIIAYVYKKNISNASFILILFALSAIELFTINGVFVQNVPYNKYLQKENALIRSFKSGYSDTLSYPRVLSLSRNEALSGNIFPAYHLRNASGFHDNELASYRNFRGENNENFMIGLDGKSKYRPFLDLANIGAIIFDSQNGTTYMKNPTAVGEAFLYGKAVVMDDASAIETLKQGKIREAIDSSLTDSLVFKDSGFYYLETVILSEAPGTQLPDKVIKGKVQLIENKKMDFQTFSVEASENGILFVSGNYHPYWKAFVNGKEQKVYKAFSTFRAVEVPKGKSTVELKYYSEPFHISLKISLAAFILLIASGVCYFVYIKKKQKV